MDKSVYRVSYATDGGDLREWYFSSRDLAEDAMRRRPNDAWYEIEDIRLDSLDGLDVEQEIPLRYVYRAIVSIIWSEEISTSEFAIRSVEPYANGCEVVVHADVPGRRDYVEASSMVSMDHAIQEAQAARMKFIRENEGRLSYDPDWHLKNRFSE